MTRTITVSHVLLGALSNPFCLFQIVTQDGENLLRNLIIEGIIPMDEELGRGAYGRVFKVEYDGVVCAAKEIHPILVEGVSPAEKKMITDNFIRECLLCSVIRHPNIVQFLGVYYSSKISDLPIMVMELMDVSLAFFVTINQSKIPMQTKISILFDVSLGLSYLHTQTPALIHTDLSPNNVLLTNQLVAKIGDLGMAKIVRQTRSIPIIPLVMVCFMPPEALKVDPVYGTAVDVFSFAGIALYVFAEEWPTPCDLKRLDLATKKLTEAERRQEYLDKIPEGASVLKESIIRCLDNDPDERPAIQEISETIKVASYNYISYQHLVCS